MSREDRVGGLGYPSPKSRKGGDSVSRSHVQEVGYPGPMSGVEGRVSGIPCLGVGEGDIPHHVTYPMMHVMFLAPAPMDRLTDSRL